MQKVKLTLEYPLQWGILMIKAVIFDLDGVLADTAECHYRAWLETAGKLGIKFNREKNHLLRGVSRRESILILIEGQIELGEDEIQKLMDGKNNIYIKLVEKAGKKLLLPGAMEFLNKLKKAGMKLALASSSRNARRILKLTELDKGFFDTVIDGNDIKNTKPDPEIFLSAAGKLNVRPYECLVAEDAPAGIEAAKRAGMLTLGIGMAELGKCDMKALSIADADFEKIISEKTFPDKTEIT